MRRITGRQLANLAVVTILGAVATTWAVIGLAGVTPFAHPETVTVRLAESGGALPGAEVTYLGVEIGTVEGARLADDALELTLTIEPKGPMASELRADVRQKTSLGEPYVDLSPAFVGAPEGEVDGAVVPIDRTSTPASLGQLFRAGGDLLDSVDPEAVRQLVDGASGLVGHAGDLRAVVSAAASVGDVVADHRAELEQLLTASATLSETLAAHTDALGRGAEGAAQLGRVLANRVTELRSLLDTGARLGTEGSQLLAALEDDLAGTLAGLEASIGVLADHPTSLHEILEYTPTFVDELGRTFSGGATWSSTQGIPGIPYSPVYGIPIAGSGLRIDKVLLPSVAQKVYADFGGQPSGTVIMSPEEAWAQSAP